MAVSCDRPAGHFAGVGWAAKEPFRLLRLGAFVDPNGHGRPSATSRSAEVRGAQRLSSDTMLDVCTIPSSWKPHPQRQSGGNAVEASAGAKE